jgi:hypothetical protein
VKVWIWSPGFWVYPPLLCKFLPLL